MRFVARKQVLAYADRTGQFMMVEALDKSEHSEATPGLQFLLAVAFPLPADFASLIQDGLSVFPRLTFPLQPRSLPP